MIILYILLALVIFGFLIFIHELGHFLVARACHVTINEFSIGMGPKLISWHGKRKKDGTKPAGTVTEDASAENPSQGDTTMYSLRLLPIGGYVSMAGEDEISDDPNAFNHKNVWQRIAITVAGAAMNILLGFLATLLLVGLTGNFRNTTVAGFCRADVNTPAVSESFLEINDKIISVNGKRTHNYMEVANEIMYNGYKAIDLVVERNGERIKIENVQFTVVTEDGVDFGDVDFITYNEAKNPWTLLKNGFFSTIAQVRMLWESLIDMITGRFGFDAVSGPVGVVQVIGETVKIGFVNLLSLFAFITLNLGVFNLLPVPALDGGRLVFLLIEAIIRKKVPAKIEATIHGAGMMLLLALMFIITVKDVIGLF